LAIFRPKCDTAELTQIFNMVVRQLVKGVILMAISILSTEIASLNDVVQKQSTN
jgi:hypothetical protein